MKFLRTKFFNKQVSNDFKNKFKNLFHKKSLSLGIWDWIIKDLDSDKIDKDSELFSDVLMKNYDKETLLSIQKACSFISDLRNPLSHVKIYTMDELIQQRIKIIDLINKVIEKLY